MRVASKKPAMNSIALCLSFYRSQIAAATTNSADGAMMHLQFFAAVFVLAVIDAAGYRGKGQPTQLRGIRKKDVMPRSLKLNFSDGTPMRLR